MIIPTDRTSSFIDIERRHKGRLEESDRSKGVFESREILPRIVRSLRYGEWKGRDAGHKHESPENLQADIPSVEALGLSQFSGDLRGVEVLIK